MPANSRTLTVVLAGDAKKAVRALDDTGSKMEALGKLAAGAAVGAGLLVAAIGVKGVQAAIEFEKSMAEVATLLPDLNKKGFKKLKDEVIAFSDEMGVATGEAVPALYQAISAGVPRDSVIDFMRTATKASIGGVTDLETAVDGITSVVNAYGAEAISAGEASDLMFTAVRLGKTTFAELSSSLFNVVPIANAAGVSFDQLTAGLATLTSQGVPTSVATTQLRAAIQALVAPTTKTKTLMTKLGLEFDQAKLAQVGLQGAFEEVIAAADGDLEVLRKLLGSVEAVQAATILGGSGAESFAANLDAMSNSAGATDAAFETMNETFARRWEVIQTRAANMLLRLGNVLLPLVITATDKLSKFIQEDAAPAVRAFAEAVGPHLKAALEQFTEFVDNEVMPAWENIKAGVGAVVAFIREHWDLIRPLLQAPFDQMLLVVSTVLNILRKTVELILNLIAGDWEGAWGNLKDIAKIALDFVVDTVKNYSALGEALLNIGKAAGKELLKGLAETAGNALEKVLGFAASGLTGGGVRSVNIPGVRQRRHSASHAGGARGARGRGWAPGGHCAAGAGRWPGRVARDQSLH